MVILAQEPPRREASTEGCNQKRQAKSCGGGDRGSQSLIFNPPLDLLLELGLFLQSAIHIVNPV